MGRGGFPKLTKAMRAIFVSQILTEDNLNRVQIRPISTVSFNQSEAFTPNHNLFVHATGNSIAAFSYQ